MKKIAIIGAGTYGEVMYELAEACGYEVEAFYDEDDQKQGILVMGVPVKGKFSALTDQEVAGKAFIVAIGNNKVRRNIMTDINERGGVTPTLIHPTAYISPSAQIGKGVYIQMGAVIWTKVILSDFVIISPNTVIAHHTKLGIASMVSTMCTVGASVEVGDYTFCGIGSIIITGVKTVGKNVYLGAGATVTKDVGDNVLLVGTPAKVIKDREPVE